MTTQYAVIGNNIKDETIVIDCFEEIETANEVKTLLEEIKGGEMNDLRKELDEHQQQEQSDKLDLLEEEFNIFLIDKDTQDYIYTYTNLRIWETTELEL